MHKLNIIISTMRINQFILFAFIGKFQIIGVTTESGFFSWCVKILRRANSVGNEN